MDTVTEFAVRKFICDNFLVEDGDFGDDDSLLETGIMDSTGILELISFLEEQFDIKVADEELLPANLDSVNKVCGFVAKKIESQKMLDDSTEG